MDLFILPIQKDNMEAHIILEINKEFEKNLGKVFSLPQVNFILSKLLDAEMKVIRQYEKRTKEI